MYHLCTEMTPKSIDLNQPITYVTSMYGLIIVEVIGYEKTIDIRTNKQTNRKNNQRQKTIIAVQI